MKKNYSTWILLLALMMIASGCQSVGYNSLLTDFLEPDPLPEVAFELPDSTLNVILDYSKYGEFKNVGTPQYRYVVTKSAFLKEVIGEGIYPNDNGILKDPEYKRLKKEGLLEGSHWEYANHSDLKRAFYRWTQAHEDPGVKLFFTARVLEQAGHFVPAIKTYYAALVHFPRSACWAADGSFVWYIAPVAQASIERLCRDYPQLKLELMDAEIDIKNGKDTDLTNDIISVNPGKIVKKPQENRRESLKNLSSFSVVETRGAGRVKLVKFSNGHWQMRVDEKPFFVRGISYSPTEVGLGPQNDHLFYARWMFSDKNKNNRIDAAYDTWVDENKNGLKDDNEPAVGDFQLMKNMGVNAIRMFPANEPIEKYNADLINKPLLRDLYETYGIGIIVGDHLGAYTIGSGAEWEKGTDYTNVEQCQKMKDSVREKVLDLKDEPFVLMWLLGNENNMPADYSGINATRTNAAAYPEAYAKFVNQVAEMIHELDGNHPVAIGNLELGLVEYYKEFAPAIDIIGVNSYRGQGGFGTLWAEAKRKFDRPVMVTEYGCDAYYQDKGIDEEAQMRYHRGNLRDIVFQQAGGLLTGISIGGVVFEFVDEWWKDTHADPVDEHKVISTYHGSFLDGYLHEEWLGITGQGSGENSPFERRLRSVYYFYQDLWNKK